MGTNYYHHAPECEHCGLAAEPVHIGKGSAGWCFALRVYPEDGISDLADWEARWAALSSHEIRDEYGNVISPTEMLAMISERSWPSRVDFDFTSNYAETGPNNLVRAKVDGRRCIGHGTGTWDLFVGDFS